MSNLTKLDKTQHPHVAGFLLKAYEIFSNAQFAEICSWGETGDSVIIFKSEEFAHSILPMYFKHNHLASFVRQLNMYGFTKKSQEGQRAEFSHRSFIRDHPELLGYIKRRISGSTLNSDAIDNNIINKAMATQFHNSSSHRPLSFQSSSGVNLSSDFSLPQVLNNNNNNNNNFVNFVSSIEQVNSNNKRPLHDPIMRRTRSRDKKIESIVNTPQYAFVEGISPSISLLQEPQVEPIQVQLKQANERIARLEGQILSIVTVLGPLYPELNALMSSSSSSSSDTVNRNEGGELLRGESNQLPDYLISFDTAIRQRAFSMDASDAVVELERLPSLMSMGSFDQGQSVNNGTTLS